MSNREKKLAIILVLAGFIVVNIFIITSIQGSIKKKEAQLLKTEGNLAAIKKELSESGLSTDEFDWLNKNLPPDGTHANIQADLVDFVEKSAQKYSISLDKAPLLLPKDKNDIGNFRSSRITVLAKTVDNMNFYRWLTELQNPSKSRTITQLRIEPQRDDPTRVDCKLELTQWFTPHSDNTSLPESSPAP